MHKYRLISKKGQGTYSEVFQALSMEDSKQVAIKRMKSTFKNLKTVNNNREIQVLKRLQPHPNIVTLLEVIYDEPSGSLALVFELMEMNMYEAIRGKTTPLPERRVKFMIYQVLKAVDHMHRHGILHRDIKPENILIDGDTVKVADFGSCQEFTKPPFTEYIGTVWYRPPECLLTDGYYNHKMDYWAVGCVFFEVLTLKPLFPGKNELDQLNKIHNIVGTPSKELKDVFRGLGNHMKKLNFPEKKGTGLHKLLLQYPAASFIISNLLVYDPKERQSASWALKQAYFKDLRYKERMDYLSTSVESLPPLEPNESSNVHDIIKIDVVDDFTKDKRSFKFNRSVLVKHMEYFQHAMGADEDEIRINCRVDIFDQLLKYVSFSEEQEALLAKMMSNTQMSVSKKKKFKSLSVGGALDIELAGSENPCGWRISPGSVQQNAENQIVSKQQQAKLDIKNASNILNVAQFLGMKSFMKQSIDFFVSNIEHIIQVQADISNIHNDLLKQITEKVTLDSLDALKDCKLYKDNFVSHLFRMKIELLVRDGHYLSKCIGCNKLFTKSQHKFLYCSKANKYGQRSQNHTIDPEWNFQEFISFLRKNYRISWREMFWKIWARIYMFRCAQCSNFFHISDLKSCSGKQRTLTNTPFSTLSDDLENGFHEISETHIQDPQQEKTILARIISHQHIVVENLGQRYIESITLAPAPQETPQKSLSKIEKSYMKTERNSVIGRNCFIKLTQQGQEPPTLIQPVSVNYNIGLVKVVEEYVKVRKDKFYKDNRDANHGTQCSLHQILEKDGESGLDPSLRDRTNHVYLESSCTNYTQAFIEESSLVESQRQSKLTHITQAPAIAAKRNSEIVEILNTHDTCITSITGKIEEMKLLDISQVELSRLKDRSKQDEPLVQDHRATILVVQSIKQKSENQNYEDGNNNIQIKDEINGFENVYDIITSKEQSNIVDEDIIKLQFQQIKMKEKYKLKRTLETPKTLNHEIKMRIEEDAAKDFKIEDDEHTFVEMFQRYDKPQAAKTYVSCTQSQSRVILLDEIGGGGQATIYESEFQGPLSRYAAKVREVLNDQSLTNQALEEAYDEFTLIQNLWHPNIIEYKYLIIQQNGHYDQYIILMDLIKGETMSTYIKDNPSPPTMDLIKEIARQLLSAIQYLHENNIIHQDIKPSNIMFPKVGSEERREIKLIDFGTARQLLQNLLITKSKLTGTHRYLSPEQLKQHLSFKNDIWQFGCVILEFTTGLVPFQGCNNITCMAKISKGKNPLEYVLQNFPERCQMIEQNKILYDFLRLCFKRNHLERPSPEQLFKHPFLNTQSILSHNLDFIRTQVSGFATRTSNFLSNNPKTNKQHVDQRIKQAAQRANFRKLRSTRQKLLQGGQQTAYGQARQAQSMHKNPVRDRITTTTNYNLLHVKSGPSIGSQSSNRDLSCLNQDIRTDLNIANHNLTATHHPMMKQYGMSQLQGGLPELHSDFKSDYLSNFSAHKKSQSFLPQIALNNISQITPPTDSILSAKLQRIQQKNNVLRSKRGNYCTNAQDAKLIQMQQLKEEKLMKQCFSTK